MSDPAPPPSPRIAGISALGLAVVGVFAIVLALLGIGTEDGARTLKHGLLAATPAALGGLFLGLVGRSTRVGRIAIVLAGMLLVGLSVTFLGVAFGSAVGG
jgi:Na+/proline symporter